MHRSWLAVCALALALAGTVRAQDAPPEPTPDPLAPPPEAVPEPPPPQPPAEPKPDRDVLGFPKTVLGETPLGAYDRLVNWKNERLPLRIGAWHWFHIRQSGPLASDYGIPGLRGTYYYYLVANPELETKHAQFPKVGAYVDFRWRDDLDRFRAFYQSNYWLWEAYAWVDTPVGRVKGGKVWKRFGLDWDGVWWGNVPYFDGYKLDPDYGLSLESELKVSDSLKLRTWVQYFFRDDRVNGELAGGDAESASRSEERDTGVVRVSPRFELGDGIALELGASAMLGRIENYRPPGGPAPIDDELPGAIALDATLTWGPVRTFLEWTQGWGVVHPARYVSGGPSNVRSTILTGVEVSVGPVTGRVSYSAGWDDNPAGWQSLVVSGITLRLLQNVSIWVEHVYWEVHGTNGDDFELFENGYQIVLNWNF